eukprot:s39_g28.t2
MKIRLQQRCNGEHEHEPIIGGTRSKRSERWPQELCQQMAAGLYDEMVYGTLKLAFPAELIREEHEEMGTLDGIYDEDDLGPVIKKRRLDDDREVDRAEAHEEILSDQVQDLVMEQERKRRGEWLRIPRAKRLAIRRLHTMTGHCSKAALLRMLKSSGSDGDVVRAAQHFQCQTCKELEVEKQPSSVKAIRPSFQQHFNYEVSADVFELHDCKGGRHSFWSLVDIATKFHVAIRVGAGGTPKSSTCAEAMNNSWIAWAGAPTYMVVDQGVHNKGRFMSLLETMGTIIRQVGVQTPWQLGTGERHGGILKEIAKHAIYDKQISGDRDMASLITECARIKNHFTNQNGYAPVQWVLGYLPTDRTSLIDGDPQEHLGVHQQVADAEDEQGPQDVFQRQLLMRQFAKEAYMRVDASQRIRKAMLRKSVPMRGPYNVGDLVSFSRKGRWFGPARVLGHEGKSSLWLVHSGVCVLVAETLVRPATSQEVLKKQLLELRPSRQRRRTIYQDDDQDDKIPFSEDTMTAGALREPHHQQPVPFVDARPAAGDDVREVEMDLAAEFGPMSPGPSDAMPAPSIEHYPVQPQYPNPVGIFDDVPDEPMVELPQTLEVRPPPGLALPQDGTASAQSLPQPEPEVAPLLTPRPPGQEAASELNPAMENSTLTQSLRRSAETLDGIPISRRQTSDSFLASKAERKYKKKTQKVGAGMELHYQRKTQEIQDQLQETMKKEWSNWERYSDGRWITQNDLDQLRMQNPNLKVIPTRWVHTSKAEPNQPMKLKSRLVVRGDLEDSSSMRCDSPTASQAAMGLVFVLSATRDTDLHCGDISAAFLQGSKMDRILVLSVPKNEGIPGVETEGKYYLVSSTAYGTKDAPRGWFKNLDATVKGKKFIPLAHEPAAYMLQNDDGSLAGLLVVHVDDLLWTGGPYIEKIMEEIQTKYNFGKTSVNRFTYCGREVVKDSTGVDEKLRGQLRSVIGSLAWYARVCRPDLSYAVCKLQSSVHAATIKYANKVYPCGVMKFEDAMIVAIQDASHAADNDVSGSGQKLGHRSQSGRLLCLAGPEFREKQQGPLLLLEWHSTIIKRVCRSTLQAETLSLLLGSEEAEHLRAVLYAMKDPAVRRPGWMISAQDSVLVDWYTDCCSLFQYINQEGLHSVSDKRLAIDMSAIRQQTWRRMGEELGDPLLTDKVPSDGTTRLLWTSTDRMLADPLTKGMRHLGLEKLMSGIRQDVISKMSPLLRQKLLEQMEATAEGACGVCLPDGDHSDPKTPSACSTSPVCSDDDTPQTSAPALSIENQVQHGPLLLQEVASRVDSRNPCSAGYRGVNTLKSRGFMYYEARLSVRNLTLASRATRTLEEAVHNHTLLATFRQIFSEKEAGVKDSSAELTARNLQKALEETEGLADVGLSLQVVMDARPWVGKMVTSPRTQEISKAISMLGEVPAMSVMADQTAAVQPCALWLEWMQMGRRERFNIRSKSLSQAQQTIWAAEQSYRPQRTKRQERRAAREWRQQQESERQELRRQEQKSREEQRWQRLVEGRLARLLLRAENCAQSLDNKEYGRTIQDSGHCGDGKVGGASFVECPDAFWRPHGATPSGIQGWYQDNDLEHVRSLFCAQVPEAQVLSIYRVENPTLEGVYSAVRDAMGSDCELDLWHGTSCECVPNIVLNGFNRAYSGRRHGTKLGHGSYFSASAAYSTRFCDRKRHRRTCFFAKVLVGEWAKGSPELVEPPCKDAEGLLRYDCTVDDTESPVNFCIFRDFQAMPTYLLEFTVATELRGRDQRTMTSRSS